MNWYYVDESGQVVGPTPESSLRELKRGGELTGASKVCREGTEDWIRLEEALGGTTGGASPSPSTIKFSCTHCGQHIAAETSDAGLSTQCPKCGGFIAVPDAGTKHQAGETQHAGNRVKLIKIGVASVATLLLVVTVFLIAKRFQHGDAGSAEHVGSVQADPERVFQNRGSNKADVLGLTGGMSKKEAESALNGQELYPVSINPAHSTSPIPGFLAFGFKPGDSFPLPHVSEITLFFLKDRLQAVRYTFERKDCAIIMYEGEGECSLCKTKHRFIHVEDDAPLGRRQSYDRSDLVSDIREAIQGSFDLIKNTELYCDSQRYPDRRYRERMLSTVPSEELFPDYTTGWGIPRGGSYEVDFDDYVGVDGIDHVRPIFNAASTEVFVRFEHALSNRNAILQDLAIELNRPSMVRVDRSTKEGFYLQFSFRHTYRESLDAGLELSARESMKQEAVAEESRRHAAEEELEKERAETERVEKLKEGF